MQDITPKHICWFVVSATMILSISCSDSSFAQSRDFHRWPLCQKIHAAIEALPKRTPIYEISSRMNVKKIIHPQWTVVNPLDYLPLIHESYNSIYYFTDTTFFTGKPGDNTILEDRQWNQLQPIILKDIENGSLRIETLAVNLDNQNSKPTRLIRISRLIDEAGPIDDPSSMKNLEERGWFYIDIDKHDEFAEHVMISSRFISSDIYEMIDLFKYYDRYYFFGIPHEGHSPALYRASLPDEMNDADRICDFDDLATPATKLVQAHSSHTDRRALSAAARVPSSR